MGKKFYEKGAVSLSIMKDFLLHDVHEIIKLKEKKFCLNFYEYLNL